MRNAECQCRGRAANDLPLQFRIPHSAFRTQASPNTIPGRCWTTPRISSSVNAVSTALVSAPAVATSTSTCLGSERSVSHSERCNALRSGGGGPPGRTPPPDLSALQRSLWETLRSEPRHVDVLVATAGAETSAVLTALTELEMRGVVQQRPGMVFGLA